MRYERRRLQYTYSVIVEGRDRCQSSAVRFTNSPLIACLRRPTLPSSSYHYHSCHCYCYSSSLSPLPWRARSCARLSIPRLASARTREHASRQMTRDQCDAAASCRLHRDARGARLFAYQYNIYKSGVHSSARAFQQDGSQVQVRPALSLSLKRVSFFSIPVW